MSKDKQAKTNKKQAKTSNQNSLIAPNTVIKLKIDKKTAQQAYDKACKKLGGKIKIPGFRAGQAPQPMVVKEVGQDKIVQEALGRVVPAAYMKAVEKSKKTSLVHPEFKLISAQPGQDWEIEAHLAEPPDVDVVSYRQVIKKAKKEAAQSWPKVKKQQDKNKSSNQASAPQKKTEKDHQLEHIYKHLVMDIKPVIPELLVKTEAQSDLNNLVQRLKNLNLDLDTFLKNRQMDFKQLSQELTMQALGRLQLSFILSKISQEEKLSVSDKEVETALQKMLENANQKGDDKLAINNLNDQQKEHYRRLIKQDLLRHKTVDHLLSA